MDTLTIKSIVIQISVKNCVHLPLHKTIYQCSKMYARAPHMPACAWGIFKMPSIFGMSVIMRSTHLVNAICMLN